MTVIPERRSPGGQPTTAALFWGRVDIKESSQCWLWTGRKDEKGYGRVGYRRCANVGAHRVSWALTHGGDLPDHCVLHRCDNPPCVNPAHLFPGTHADNNRDRQAKGRTRGWAGATESDHHAFRVSTAVASAMVARRRQGASQQVIAAEFGVSRGHVSKVLRGLTVASGKVS